MESNKLLKVSGILMIIGGGISIVIGLIAFLALLAVAALAVGVGEGGAGILLIVAGLLVLVGGAVELVAGILGVKNAAKPEKAGSCIVFGIIVAVVSVLSAVLNLAGGESINFFNLGLGLVLPALYLVGAFQNKSKVS